MYGGWHCHRLVYDSNMFGNISPYFHPDICIDSQNENKETRVAVNTLLRISGINP